MKKGQLTQPLLSFQNEIPLSHTLFAALPPPPATLSPKNSKGGKSLLSSQSACSSLGGGSSSASGGAFRCLQGSFVTGTGLRVSVVGDIARFRTAGGRAMVPAHVLEVREGVVCLKDVPLESADDFEVRWSDGEIWTAVDPGDEQPAPAAAAVSPLATASYSSASSASSAKSPSPLLPRDGSNSPPSPQPPSALFGPSLVLSPAPRAPFWRRFLCCSGGEWHSKPPGIAPSDPFTPLDCSHPSLQPLILKVRVVLRHILRRPDVKPEDLKQLAATVCIVLGRIESGLVHAGHRLDLLIEACSNNSACSLLAEEARLLRARNPSFDPKLPGLSKSKVRIVELWWSIDKDGDGFLDFQEIKHLMSLLNFNIKESDLRKRLDCFDDDNNEKLDFFEFVNLYQGLQERKELEPPFRQLIATKGTMSEKFHHFLTTKQHADCTLEEAQQVLRDWSSWNDAEGESMTWTLQEFSAYLTSTENSWWDPNKKKLYMDMDQPLAHYYINSSHNTYLTGSQHSSEASAHMYYRALKTGVRCVEVDCWNRNKMPVVTHGRTMVNQIPFEEVARTIAQYAFVSTPFPLIISIENQISEASVQEILADLLVKYLGKYLLLPPLGSDPWQMTPNKLKNKILLRSKSESAPGLRKLLALVSGKINTSTKNPRLDQCPSCPEGEADQHIRRASFVELTKKQLIRVYPSGTRVTSTNFSPAPLWARGAQLCAMNVQRLDPPMRLNMQRFFENGRSGYLLKPGYLRRPGVKPPSSPTMKLVVSVLSGGNIPKPKRAEKGEIVDPYVCVEIDGAACDVEAVRTNHVVDNGFDPYWKDNFAFLLRYPEVAVLTLRVKDHDFIGEDQLLGEASCPVSCLRAGYRSVPLYDERLKLIHDAFVLIRVSFMPL